MAGQDSPTLERGAHARKYMCLPALLLGHGLCSSVTIRDYSMRGLCLDGAFGFETRERVTVELLTGQRLPVVVAWSKGTEIGVRFVGPITSGHPALLALEMAAEAYKLLHPGRFKQTA